jgi:hypothetical protein
MTHRGKKIAEGPLNAFMDRAAEKASYRAHEYSVTQRVIFDAHIDDALPKAIATPFQELRHPPEPKTQKPSQRPTTRFSRNRAMRDARFNAIVKETLKPQPAWIDAMVTERATDINALRSKLGCASHPLGFLATPPLFPVAAKFCSEFSHPFDDPS